MKKYASLFLSPLAVMALMGIVFFAYGLYPFGQNTLAWCDMTQQVLPLLLEFKDMLSGAQDFFLSMANAGGMNFWGVFLFFISSPFSFLVAFVEKANLIQFANVMVVLKMMACAFTAALFFQKRFPKLGTALVTALGALYACCGYTMLFYQNVVWLDMMYLFPLLLLGFDRLVRLEKPLMYVLTLSAVVTVNFYLSYMVVIFLVLSMGLYLLLCCKKEQRGPVALRLCVSSLLAALITASVWLPAFQQYLTSGRGENGLLQNLASGKLLAVLFTTVPLLLCTTLAFAALPFLSLKEERRRERIGYLALILVLMLLPVFIEPINKMWHTGSYQAFPVRYGYITIFVGLILAAMILQKGCESPRVKPTDWPMLIVAFLDGGVLVAVFYYMLFNHQAEMSRYTQTLWGNQTSFTYLLLSFLVAFVCYFLAIYLFKFGHITKRVFSVLLCVLVAAECVFNGSIYMGSVSGSVTRYQQVVDLQNRLPTGQGFYRVKTDRKYFDANMVGAIGYNSLAHYTSLNAQNYMFAMKKLGYSSYWMEVNSNDGTLLTDALLSNRYTILQSREETDGRPTLYENEQYRLVENPLFLPLGLKTATDLSAYEALPEGTRREVQNHLYRTLLGGEGELMALYQPNHLQSVNWEENETGWRLSQQGNQIALISYEIPVKEKQTLYFDCFNRLTTSLNEPVNNAFQVTVNDLVVEGAFPNQNSNGLLELGTFEQETVRVDLYLLKNVSAKSFGVYGLSHEKLNQALERAQPVDVSVDGRALHASCQGQAGEYLYFSLPYDKGYRAAVNGKPAEVLRVNDSFLAVRLEQGQNQVTLSFLPNGLLPGLILTGAGVLLTLALWLFARKKRFRPMPALEAVSYWAFLALTVLVFLAIYVFPLAVFFLL